MRGNIRWLLGVVLLAIAVASYADSYQDAVQLFHNAGQSGRFFQSCYGYAIFPTVGKGGFIVGGGHGDGHVYVHGKYVGDMSLTQLSVGLQAGGQAYSQIIFFEDKRAFDEFTNGSFEFGADANAVAITAAAEASAGTTGASAGASGGMKDAVTAGHYYRGFAVFTIVKGGAMYEATIAGQKFTYTPQPH
jgi:lipid-binding SYLF domain-containing protein